VFRFLDYVFGSMATMPDRLVCRPDIIFHRISDNGPNLGDLATSMLDRCWNDPTHTVTAALRFAVFPVRPVA